MAYLIVEEFCSRGLWVGTMRLIACVRVPSWLLKLSYTATFFRPVGSVSFSVGFIFSVVSFAVSVVAVRFVFTLPSANIILKFVTSLLMKAGGVAIGEWRSYIWAGVIKR